MLAGVAAGLALTAIVAVLTFIAHRKLPYRRMLVFTGIMLGVVLLVMVGEQAQEMQLAHWLPTTAIAVARAPDSRVDGTLARRCSRRWRRSRRRRSRLCIVIGSYFIARRDTSRSTLITPDEAPAV